MGLSVVGLIPARSGSERIPGKNVKELHGVPLIAYAIASARESSVFTDVIVSTDSEDIAVVARTYGAWVFLRPEQYATAESPDIEWVGHALRFGERPYDAFAILRPTSPFRSAAMIRRAWETLRRRQREFDSLRAVELAGNHPGKMWHMLGNGQIVPLMPLVGSGPKPWHSQQTTALPAVYVQNASLEMAWASVPLEQGTIAGERVLGFVTEGHEGFDINNPLDWLTAELLIERGLATLPEVRLVD